MILINFDPEIQIRSCFALPTDYGAVLWIGIVLMPIRIRISILVQIHIQIQIRTGIKTMPIHMRILPQVLHMLDKGIKMLLLFNNTYVIVV